jgi:hypothetical protein
MNPNTEYERFAQEIYQGLVDVDVVKTTNVQHNVKLVGKSGQPHQIDVYWEYEIAGIKHNVAIECKNYNSAVPVGKVRDFYGVLSDLSSSGILKLTPVFSRLPIIHKLPSKDWRILLSRRFFTSMYARPQKHEKTKISLTCSSRLVGNFLSIIRSISFCVR